MIQKGFSYEGNLPHQTKAVESVVNCFECADKKVNRNENPLLDLKCFV